MMPWRALAIPESLRAIMALVPARNVHVISDGSTDDTVVMLPDADTRVQPAFLFTCAVAVLERQPRLPLAVFFPFMRMLDAAISLYSVPAAWLLASNGRWKSPARRPVAWAAPAPLPATGRRLIPRRDQG